MKLAHRWRLLTLLMLLVCMAAARSAPAAAALPTEQVSSRDSALALGQQDADSVSLTPYFEVLEDPSTTLTLSDVQQDAVVSRFRGGNEPASALNFGYSSSAWWLRLRLQNTGEQPIERLLEMRWPGLSSISFHQSGADGVFQTVDTGNALPFATRQHANRFFVFTVNVQPRSEQVVYLRLQSLSTMGALGILWKPKAFYKYEREDYLTQGGLIGIALALIAFNLLLFVAIRDVIYLMYVAYASLMTVAIADHTGLAKEFLWPQATDWSNISKFTLYALTFAAAIVFSRRMLDTPTTVPRMDRALKALFGVFLLWPIGYLIAFPALSQAAVVLHIAGVAMLMGTGVYCAWLRQRSAYFFVVAFASVALGVTMGSLRGLGLMPSNALSINGMQTGAALEMLLLAFALADRFNQIRREKDQARRAAQQAQQELVETLRWSELELEKRVSRRTDELQVSNAALQTSLIDLQTAQVRLVASEQRALQGEQVATEAMAAQHQFVAMVSHEFRLPLTVIDSAAQLLSIKLAANEVALPVLARIRRGAARLSTFLENCLTGDRLDANSVMLHPQAIDLATFAASVVESAQLLTNGHQIRKEITPEIGMLNADPHLLRIMLLNLLVNAIKYSPPASAITLRIEPDGKSLVFSVIDQGQGIPTEELPKVFHKYVRGSAVGSIPGAGLGLSLVKRIVDLHGGSIHIDSQVGQGTRVVVAIEDHAVTVSP